MEIDVRSANAQTPAIGEKGIKFLDILVSSRLPQLNPLRAILFHQCAVNPEAVPGETILRVLNEIVRCFLAEVRVEPAQSNLFQEKQFLVRSVLDGQFDGNLCALWICLVHRRSPLYGERHSGTRKQPIGRGHCRQLEKLTAPHVAGAIDFRL